MAEIRSIASSRTQPKAADIGEITREIEVVPIEQPVEAPPAAPVEEPAAPQREEEPVPA